MSPLMDFNPIHDRGVSPVEVKAQRKDELLRRKEEITINTAKNAAKDWRQRIAKQGPWDPEYDDGFSLLGAPSEPMPVKISDTQDFNPFFAHLKANGTDVAIHKTSVKTNGEDSAWKEGFEPYYGTHLLEFPKGVLYSDNRMDLCKQVLGPPSLSPLMDSLESNSFVRHFLFGNNVIGPAGAKRIRKFIREHPNQIETWYLAGNCINTESFSGLVPGLVESPVITNVWLKRNPLGPESANDIFKLITEASNLRTLDLDQTALGDNGVSEIFSQLADHVDKGNKIALQHIYLNANGVGAKAATQISRFLASQNCALISLYISCNPLGNAGVIELSKGLGKNKTLQRLLIQSVGVTDEGATALFDTLGNDASIITLDIGHAYATEDLGARYNWLTDAVIHSFQDLINKQSKLRYLDLGYTQLSQSGLNVCMQTMLDNEDHLLLYFFGRARHESRTERHDATHQNPNYVKDGQNGARLKTFLTKRLQTNVRSIYGADMGYEKWFSEEKRFLFSPQDVRYIDSVYRNRDAGLARRGLKQLKKVWNEGDKTLQNVLTAT